MKKCENCEILHDGKYGSGRFCSSKCARGFSTKAKRKSINEKISKKLKGDSRCAWNKGKGKKPMEYVCNECGKKIYSTRERKYCSRECTSKNVNWSSVQKKAYADGAQRVGGGGRTKWYDYKDIKVQGTYELRTCAILDEWKARKFILDWEYTNDRYQYLWEDGTEHTYLLDFKVFITETEFYYIETKGYIRENDERKWEAVKKLGHELKVWFNEDIKREEEKLDL